MSVLFYAGRGLTKVDVNTLPRNYEECDEGMDSEDLFGVEYNQKAPWLSDGLERGAIYRCAHTVFFAFPHWRVCADWAEKLWELVGCTDEELLAEGSTVAFREFFLWAQNGTVGPLASARLAAQFSEWDERAKTFAAQFTRQRTRVLAEEQFYEIFDDMRKMFAWTSNDGIVFLRSA